MNGRRLGFAIAAASAFGLLACNAILGMNAPSLAQCTDGCADGATEEGGDGTVMPGADASADAVDADSAPDTSPPDAADAADAADGGVDAMAEASTDAALDVQTGSPDAGFKCGGGRFPTSWCDPQGATPICCQGGTASAPTFTCVANGVCSGYAIECANYNDCSGTKVCCRFVAHQICDLAANCPNDELVCDSVTTDVCPTGTNCDVPFIGDAAAQSPYLGCGP